MNILLNYTLSFTNYKMTNQNNLYNFIINIIEKEEDDENKIKFVLSSIKINIGMVFYTSFMSYVYKKLPKDHLIIKLG